MIQRQVLLTAEHHNWGLSSIYDWHQTKYTLFKDGTLQSVVFEGRSIYSTERHIKDADLRFISDNIKDFVLDAPKTDSCDGDAWQFEGSDFSFSLGYIYGTELEKIAEILEDE